MDLLPLTDMDISILKSNMSSDQAIRKLMPPGLRGVLRRCWNGNVLGLADVYIPYRLYKVTMDDRRLQTTRYYAVDAATGALDAYEFQVPPPDQMFVEVATRNCHPVRLDEIRTRQLAVHRVRRSVFSKGMFRLSDPVFAAELLRRDFYIPYWLGFYGERQNLKVVVLNAVRQTYEGSKVCRLVENWLKEIQIHQTETVAQEQQ